MRNSICLVAVFVLLFPYALCAQDLEADSDYFFPYRMKYVSVHAGRQSLEGDDFEGMTFYGGPDGTVYLVPSLDTTAAFGATFGFKEKWYGSELTYTYAAYDWGWGGIPDWGKATRHVLDLNGKAYAFASSEFQPFALAGLSLDFFSVEDGQIKPNLSLTDESMTGIGVNAGGGVDYYVGGTMMISAGVTWHGTYYNTISGQSLDEGMYATGVDYHASVGFLF